MQDVLAKLKAIQENYDNEDIQRAITAAEKTSVAEEVVEDETVEEATDEVVDEAEETVEEDSVEEVHEEEVSESVDQDATDFERMLKLAGQSGVIGMSTNNILVTESVEVSEETVEEEAFVAKEADEDDDEDDEEEVDESFETVEAVGDSAEAFYQLQDEFAGGEADGAHKALIDELIRYLSGDQIADFVADFRRHYDMNDMEENVEEGDYGDDDANFEEDIEESESVEEATVEVPVQELAELMKLAGYENYADQIEEYANEPAEEYSDVEDQMIGLSGGLNGPKKAYAAAAGGDNPMDQEPTDIEEDDKLTFEGMYKRYMTPVAEETLQEKE